MFASRRTVLINIYYAVSKLHQQFENLMSLAVLNGEL